MAVATNHVQKGEHRLCRRLTTHIAWALIVYTLIQIGLISGLDIGKSSIWPYIGLVAVVFGIIPLFASMQRRWKRLTEAGLPEAGLRARFRLDIIKLWLMAIILPCIWTAIFYILDNGA